MEKEYKYKVFYIDKSGNNIGWQVQGDDIKEVQKDAKEMDKKYAVKKEDIEEIDRRVENPNEELSFGDEERTCGKCGKPMKLIPAGVSKRTGKAYNAFWGCPNNCK